MSIVLARLQPRDARKGWLTRDYTSTRGNTYRAGDGGVPSPLTRVSDERELAELREFSAQIEIIEVDDEQHLAAILQHEMEQRVRSGGPPIRAEVLGVIVPEPEPLAAPRRTLSKVVPPAAPPAAPLAATAAHVDAEGDLTFDPAPIPAAPPGAPDEGGQIPAPAPASGRKGGRRVK